MSRKNQGGGGGKFWPLGVAPTLPLDVLELPGLFTEKILTSSVWSGVKTGRAGAVEEDKLSKKSGSSSSR